MGLDIQDVVVHANRRDFFGGFGNRFSLFGDFFRDLFGIGKLVIDFIKDFFPLPVVFASQETVIGNFFDLFLMSLPLIVMITALETIFCFFLELFPFPVVLAAKEFVGLLQKLILFLPFPVVLASKEFIDLLRKLILLFPFPIVGTAIELFGLLAKLFFPPLPVVLAALEHSVTDQFFELEHLFLNFFNFGLIPGGLGIRSSSQHNADQNANEFHLIDFFDYKRIQT